MTAWINSPEHRDNILEPGYKEIGVGTVWGTPANASMLVGGDRHHRLRVRQGDFEEEEGQEGKEVQEAPAPSSPLTLTPGR